MLADEARQVTQRTVTAVQELRGDSERRHGSKITGMPGDHAQERLRWLKDEINRMEGRVQGFVRAMNEMLDEDEDMALMNLSRLLTHPERFVQPVSQEILQEESDEPELILEAYLQQALSIVNELELLKAQIMTTQEQISMTLDAMRNKLLYINTLLSLASFCVATGSFIGSLFGMNLHNPFEDQDTDVWFLKVTWGTSIGIMAMFFILAWFFYKQTSSSTNFRKKRL
jgi:magnesium transporter